MKDQDITKVEDPDDPEGWFDLGVRLGEKGNFKKAIEAFKKGLNLNPEDVMAWINLGVAYGQIGDSQAEIEAYEKALKLEPKNVEVWVNLGVVLEETNNFKD